MEGGVGFEELMIAARAGAGDFSINLRRIISVRRARQAGERPTRANRGMKRRAFDSPSAQVAEKPPPKKSGAAAITKRLGALQRQTQLAEP
jgi:hypothetical protein